MSGYHRNDKHNGHCFLNKGPQINIRCSFWCVLTGASAIVIVSLLDCMFCFAPSTQVSDIGKDISFLFQRKLFFGEFTQLIWQVLFIKPLMFSP